MSNTVIHVENISKEYRLGTIGHGTIRQDMQSWWARVRGKEDPNSQIALANNSQQSKNGRFWALKDVSFDVEQGEVLGIIGRNGAGKSTLLKILSRITAPTTGTIKIKGRIASLLEVGTGFHPELTGRENVYLNGTILGMKKCEIDAKFDEIVKFAEIEKFIDTPVKRYSSGMYVRLAFAVAAHLEPEILILDEVLAVGDAAFQKKCLGKMGEVAKGGRTVLFVSHNMQAIRQLCDRTIMLGSGRILIDDDSTIVIDNYLQESNKKVDNSKSIDEIIRNLPPDPVFKLEGIKLIQNGNQVEQLVGNGYPLEIEIRYRVFEKTTGLRVYFDLCDSQDLLLFRSFHDEDNEGIPEVEPGYYVSNAVIPADLLAPVGYNLRVYGTIFNVRTFIPSGITIPISVERTGKANQAYLIEPIRGKLAPTLMWKTEKI